MCPAEPSRQAPLGSGLFLKGDAVQPAVGAFGLFQLPGVVHNLSPLRSIVEFMPHWNQFAIFPLTVLFCQGMCVWNEWAGELK